jgi:hypothetical protein
MSYESAERGYGAPASVRLEPGSHRSPHDGVCIVELASMIGGEPFTDRPDCVCPVIAGFLRSWNDRAGYSDRQRLRPYAERVVGTGGFRRISRIRRDLCLRWAGADTDRGPVSRVVDRLVMRMRIAWAVGLLPAFRLNEGAGAYAAQVCFASGGAGEAFALLDRMLEVGGAPEPLTRPRLPGHWVPGELDRLAPGTPNGNGNGHSSGGRDRLGIRATIIAREAGPPRSRGARESDSATGGDGDRPRDRRAVPPASDS